ncbi:hypothetical protein RFI_09017, partial [Reticulomyxa filosa]
TNVEKVLRVWDTYYTFPPYFTKELRDIVTGVKDLEKEKQEKDRLMKEQKEKEEKMRRQNQQQQLLQQQQQMKQLLPSKMGADSTASAIGTGGVLLVNTHAEGANDGKNDNKHNPRDSNSSNLMSAPEVAPVFQRLAEQQKQKQMQQMMQPNININISLPTPSSIPATIATPTPILSVSSSMPSSSSSASSVSSSSSTSSSTVVPSLYPPVGSHHHSHPIISHAQSQPPPQPQPQPQTQFGHIRHPVGGPILTGVPSSMPTFQPSVNPMYGMPASSSQNSRFQTSIVQPIYGARPPSIHGHGHGQITYAPSNFILTGVPGIPGIPGLPPSSSQYPQGMPFQPSLTQQQPPIGNALQMNSNFNNGMKMDMDVDGVPIEDDLDGDPMLSRYFYFLKNLVVKKIVLHFFVCVSFLHTSDLKFLPFRFEREKKENIEMQKKNLYVSINVFFRRGKPLK